MTKCEADDYLEIGESDRKIRRTEFFRKLSSRGLIQNQILVLADNFCCSSTLFV
jgi:hypothetical protein